MSDSDGKINWFEIPAAETDRARSFYGGLFGWTFQPFDDSGNYFMTDAGAVFPSGQKGIMVYFSTSDIDASIAKIKELGGSSDEPQAIPPVGRYARCTDSEGNAFGLFQRDQA